MSDVKEILSSKKYPTQIKDHQIFKNIKEITKVFPLIGLPNCEEELAIDNSKEVSQSAKALLTELSQLISKREVKLSSFGEKKTSAESKKMKAERKQKFDNCVKLLKDLQATIKANPDKCITQNAGKTTLNLPVEINGADGKPIFKSGEGLLRVYNKLNELLTEGHFLPMKKVDGLYSFKDFSAKNIPATKHKLVFSSDGVEGVWDVATMSMRGITSCQTWGGGNATHVVGSMIDPFTGIIYLTSGAKHGDYGTKMMRRSVVRFVVNEKTKQPALYLERMYPAYDAPSAKTFVDFLRKKTENKFPIIDGNNGGSIAQHYVPMSSTIKSLEAAYQPYRDSGMQYKIDSADFIGAMREKGELVFGKIHAAVGAKVLSAIRTLKIGSVPEEYKETLRMVRGTSAYNDVSYLVYDDLVSMSKKFFSGIDIKKFTDPSKLMETTLKDFSEALEDRIFECLKSSVKMRLKNAFISYTETKNRKTTLPDKVLQTVSEKASSKILDFINDELETIMSSKKSSGFDLDKLPVYVKLLN